VKLAGREWLGKIGIVWREERGENLKSEICEGIGIFLDPKGDYALLRVSRYQMALKTDQIHKPDPTVRYPTFILSYASQTRASSIDRVAEAPRDDAGGDDDRISHPYSHNF